MRRLSIIVLVVGLLALAIPASAQEPEFDEHPHMLILGLELDASGEPIGFRKCVDLAANNALVLTAHHQNVHFGTAGEMLFTKAGNVVVPGAPFPAPFEEPVPCSNLRGADRLLLPRGRLGSRWRGRLEGASAPIRGV
jgi:hypothetical protein